VRPITQAVLDAFPRRAIAFFPSPPKYVFHRKRGRPILSAWLPRLTRAGNTRLLLLDTEQPAAANANICLAANFAAGLDIIEVGRCGTGWLNHLSPAKAARDRPGQVAPRVQWLLRRFRDGRSRAGPAPPCFRPTITFHLGPTRQLHRGPAWKKRLDEHGNLRVPRPSSKIPYTTVLPSSRKMILLFNARKAEIMAIVRRSRNLRELPPGNAPVLRTHLTGLSTGTTICPARRDVSWE